MNRAVLIVSSVLVAWCQPFGGLNGQASIAVRPSTGPVAVAAGPASTALVLNGDGTVVSCDGVAVGPRVYRVSSRYFAADIATLPAATGLHVVLSVNQRNDQKLSSWVLQVRPDGQEVWTWMPKRGIYIGLAVDAGRGQIYAANSSDNSVYRLAAGDQKVRPVEVAHIADAERIGPIALDPGGQRLFVVDMATGGIHVVPLDGRGKRVRLEVPNAEDIRAVSWSTKTSRLYVADAGQEAVFVIDPDGRTAPASIRDKRFREPAGLSASENGIWLVDEGAKAAFQIVEGSMTVGRAVAWASRK